jgi:small subunit ribosomal protein S2
MRGLGGIRLMTTPPAVIYIIDSKKETTAIAEAKKLGIPIIAVVDTNCDPDEVEFPIPANDDAIRSIKLLTSIIAEAVIAGRELTKPIEERAPEIAVPIEIGEETMEEATMLTEEERLAELATKLPVPEEDKERIGF